MEKKKPKIPNTWFIADLHFRHKNVLKHCPKRAELGGFQIDDVEAHDKWLMEKWNSTVAKKDTVYIVGDFSFAPSEHVKKLLSKLNGNKFLILGNHDQSSSKLTNYFVQITQQKMVVFKKSNYDWLDEDFQVFLCHYPMVTWPSKHYGSVNVHGHCHGRLNRYNEESTDLRVDVGIDSETFGNDFVEVRTLYEYFKNKRAGEKFIHYANRMKEQMEMPI